MRVLVCMLMLMCVVVVLFVSVLIMRVVSSTAVMLDTQMVGQGVDGIDNVTAEALLRRRGKVLQWREIGMRILWFNAVVYSTCFVDNQASQKPEVYRPVAALLLLMMIMTMVSVVVAQLSFVHFRSSRIRRKVVWRIS